MNKTTNQWATVPFLSTLLAGWRLSRFSSWVPWSGLVLGLLIGLLWEAPARGQVPSLVWQKALGGSNSDYANAITASPDGGYVVAGYTYSTDGDVSGTHVYETAWVVKLDGAGNKLWQKALDGSEASAIIASPDGGYVVAGSTSSTNGKVSGTHGYYDYWVVKIDGAGNKLWQIALGGSDLDEAKAIIASPDGGYIVAGATSSNDGDVSGNHGNADYWVVKLDKDGNISWQKALGGSGSDGATAITASSDGGYVVAGTTYSTDGDVTDNNSGGADWVVKLDGAGNIVWQKALGGFYFVYATAVTASPDGGYVLAGITYPYNGDASGFHGLYDYRVVKLDGSGNKLWQKVLGGSRSDEAKAITATPDGGCVVAGYTQSNDGDVSGNHGEADYWVVKLGGAGDVVWQKALGGSDDDYAGAITASPDGGYVVAGYAYSKNGNVSGNHGMADYWVVKLGNPAPAVTDLTASPSTICAGQPLQLTATLGAISGPYTYTVTNGAGLSQQGTSSTNPFLLTITAPGAGPQSLSLRVSTADGVGSATVGLTVNASPAVSIVNLASSYCQTGGAEALVGTPSGGIFTLDGSLATSMSPSSLSVGQHTVVYSFTNTNGCNSSTTQTVSLYPTPMAPQIVTLRGQSYPDGVSSLTVAQNTSDVILAVSGCQGGTITWDGGSATTLSVSTASLGAQRFTATCTSNGCTSSTATATVTVTLVSPMLKVLSRDPDNGQLNNNTLKPYLLLQNAGTTPIPYNAITLRYWLTIEDNIFLLFQKNYVAIGQNNLNLRYVSLSPARQGATGYIEYSFSGGAGSLAPTGDSGPIEIQVYKQNYSGFFQGDDYSYINNGGYTLNPRITAYQNGVIIYGVEPSGTDSFRVAAEETRSLLQVNVLGNPVVGQSADVEISGVTGQSVQVKLIDVQGKLLRSQSISSAGSVERISLHLGNAQGLLLLEVSTASQRQQIKLVRP